MILQNIRNFSIIAHVDHGKSTLSDRLIEKCNPEHISQDQALDSMDLEREKGITIKAQTVRLLFKHPTTQEKYTFNLIDTPGHDDFRYEVEKGLSSVEGSIIIVDAAQGIEAQTIQNTAKALKANHKFIVALNKIDLPAADIEKVTKEAKEFFGEDTAIFPISAKTGVGINELIEGIIKYLPAPQDPKEQKLKALLIDSWYDKYLGVIVLIRIFSGMLKKDMQIQTLGTNKKHKVTHVGNFLPKKNIVSELHAGDIGFLTTGVKVLSSFKVGDTICEVNNLLEPISGFKPNQPVIFCGIYPENSDNYKRLDESLHKLHLNDSSFTFTNEVSIALGQGYRCGFLGLLHLEIIQQRLLREFNIPIITTMPNVSYRLTLKDKKTNNKEQFIDNAIEFPEPQIIEKIEEPRIKATIIIPEDYLGELFDLCEQKRGIQLTQEYNKDRYTIIYDLPLNEIIFDFYDKLKSLSQGFASFSWEFFEYRETEIIKLKILLNSEEVPELSTLVHQSKAESIGRHICTQLKTHIDPHYFMIPIQAAIGGKIIARETIKALRKDVLAKCYGGDISRKKKLLEKQKQGRKKAQSTGKVHISSKAFLSLLKTK